MAPASATQACNRRRSLSMIIYEMEVSMVLVRTARRVATEQSPAVPVGAAGGAAAEGGSRVGAGNM